MRIADLINEDRPLILQAGSYSVGVKDHLLDRAEQRHVTYKDILSVMHRLDSVDQQIQALGLEMGQGFWLRGKVSLHFTVLNLPAHRLRLNTVWNKSLITNPNTPIINLPK
jgi:hypothetical protein